MAAITTTTTTATATTNTKKIKSITMMMITIIIIYGVIKHNKNNTVCHMTAVDIRYPTFDISS